MSLTLFVKARDYEPSKDKKSHIQEIKKGFAYMKVNSFLCWLLLFQIIVLVLISPSAFLTPLMVSRDFGVEVWRLSVSEMTFSAGACLEELLLLSGAGLTTGFILQLWQVYFMAY